METGQATVTAGREIRLRPLTQIEDFREAVALQKLIWGFADQDLLPVRLFVVAVKVGGQAFGAFHGDRMVGFLLAIPGLKAGGRQYLHSHMMGVAHEYRNDGIGRLLKYAQRDDALERGIDLIEWTFDPLELKNAYFNVERLGAVVQRYVRNNYGTTSSVLHGGLPTDRCVAEWWIRPETWLRGAVEAELALPANIAEMRASDPRRAKQIQAEASDRFEAYFDRGLAVTGFERTPESGIYRFGRLEKRA